jgi:hypothetical protein
MLSFRRSILFVTFYLEEERSKNMFYVSVNQGLSRHLRNLWHRLHDLHTLKFVVESLIGAAALILTWLPQIQSRLAQSTIIGIDVMAVILIFIGVIRFRTGTAASPPKSPPSIEDMRRAFESGHNTLKQNVHEQFYGVLVWGPGERAELLHAKGEQIRRELETEQFTARSLDDIPRRMHDGSLNDVRSGITSFLREKPRKTDAIVVLCPSDADLEEIATCVSGLPREVVKKLRIFLQTKSGKHTGGRREIQNVSLQFFHQTEISECTLLTRVVDELRTARAAKWWYLKT